MTHSVHALFRFEQVTFEQHIGFRLRDRAIVRIVIAIEQMPDTHGEVSRLIVVRVELAPFAFGDERNTGSVNAVRFAGASDRSTSMRRIRRTMCSMRLNRRVMLLLEKFHCR